MSRTTRKPYSRSKKLDATCRSHGSCPYCANNRQHNNKKRKIAANELLEEYYDSKKE